jgi:hypothetical protein
VALAPLSHAGASGRSSQHNSWSLVTWSPGGQMVGFQWGCMSVCQVKTLASSMWKLLYTSDTRRTDRSGRSPWRPL